MLLLLIITLVSCSENYEKIIVEDSQLVDLKNTIESLNTIGSLPKVNTFRVNQFWEELDIQSITLYTYYPEACLIEQRKVGESNLKRDDNHILDKNMELNQYVLNDYTTELDSIDFERLKSSILIETSFSEGVSGCFEPHHGFVLKNRKDNIVGHISVCLACSNYQIYPKRSGQIPMDLFRSVIVKNKLPIHRDQVGKAYRKEIENNLQSE